MLTRVFNCYESPALDPPKKIGCKKLSLSGKIRPPQGDMKCNIALRRLVPEDCVHHQEVRTSGVGFGRKRDVVTASPSVSALWGNVVTSNHDRTGQARIGYRPSKDGGRRLVVAVTDGDWSTISARGLI